MNRPRERNLSFRSSSSLSATRDAARGGGGEGRPQSFTRCAICDTLLYNTRQRAVYARPPLVEGEEKKAAEILYGASARTARRAFAHSDHVDFSSSPFLPCSSLPSGPRENVSDIFLISLFVPAFFRVRQRIRHCDRDLSNAHRHSRCNN